ncbi:MAG: hypothetical protein Q4G63_13090 [Bacteroidia bacterium]|nr:hypothetical protein [Bacteroidia bacterium]
MTVEAYKLSETQDSITIRIEVLNTGDEDIQIENFPDYAREEKATFIYFLSTEERNDMNGKVFFKVFPFIFTPKEFKGKEENYKRISYLIKKRENGLVDYTLSKKKFNNDKKIIVYGEICYLFCINNNKKGRFSINTNIKY